MISLVFVCHGSICRSPAAEMICRSLSKDVSVCSRAVSYEEIGNDIYPPMEAELHRRGVPLSLHHAALLTKNDVRNADYVFYMDESNKRRLLAMGLYEEGKTLPIFAFTPSIDEVEDPWYTGRYELVCDQITECVKDILDKIGARGL